MISVVECLRQSGKLIEAGNASYVTELTNLSGFGLARTDHYCKLLVQMQIERQLVVMATEIIRMSDETNDVSDTISFADRQLQKINEIISLNSRMEHISSAVEKAADESILRTENRRQGKMSGVTSGLKDLDKMTSGFKGSELIILAGRPGSGKTSVMLHFAKVAARNGVPVCIYSLEMDSISLADRLILSETDIEADRYRNG